MARTRGAKKKQDTVQSGAQDPEQSGAQDPEQSGAQDPEQSGAQAPEQSGAPEEQSVAESDARFPVRLILFMKEPLPGYREFSCFRVDELKFVNGTVPFELFGDATLAERFQTVQVTINDVQTDACIFGRVESGNFNIKRAK